MLNIPQQIGDLSQHFAPQQQLAQQSQQNLLAQALSNTKGSNLGNTLARQFGGLRTQVPQFEQVQARGIGEGLLKAIPAGLNNAMQLGAYRRQQENQQQLVDLAIQQDLARAQKEQALLLEKQRQIDLGNQSLGALNPTLDPMQLQALQNANIASGGSLFPELAQRFGQGQVDLGMVVPQATAEAQGKVAGIGVLDDAMQQAGPLSVQGVPQEGAVNKYRQLYGQAPITQQDIEGKEIQNEKGRQDLAYTPVQRQQQLEMNEIKIATDKVNAKYAEATAQLDNLLKQNKLEEYQEAKEKLEQGRQMWDKAMASYGNMTQGQVELINAKFKSLELPYELPNKQKLEKVVNKGEVKSFADPYTGTVYKPKKGE